MKDVTLCSRSLPQNQLSQRRAAGELVLISVILLFLELSCIRWFPATVPYLTFFTNIVLLACFLGMSLGCLAARWSRNLLIWTPILLTVAVASARGLGYHKFGLEKVIDVGHQASPQVVYFGTEYHVRDLARFAIPVEALCGFFFLLLALSFIGLGQELGRALNRHPRRVTAYTLNILGSIIGIVLFAVCAWLQMSPLWWFLPTSCGMGYFLSTRPASSGRIPRFIALASLAATPMLVWFSPTTWGDSPHDRFWSPYYRIDYDYKHRSITANRISHQSMVSRSEGFSAAYALPHLLNRDAGRPPFEDVLIIGAGSGNDVSRALQWGARHVDAVEIDPVIYRLGAQFHPDRPYQDPRVSVHLDDGRNFLRSTRKRYDLIVYALVDSLVLHSSFSNIRLESYLFTREALAEVRRHLKPGGVFIMYNYFRQGWIVARLHRLLETVFEAEPLVLTLPYSPRIEMGPSEGFTVFLAGDTGPIRRAFEHHSAYWLKKTEPPGPESPNGFELASGGERSSDWVRFGPATLASSSDPHLPTDDWPFLYIRQPMIPDVNLRGALIMGAIAFVLIILFLPRPQGVHRRAFNGTMFFLGAGFMLIETRAVVHAALLFGSTWVINSIVFFAVLVMILLANLYALRIKPSRLWPYYAGVAVTLTLNFSVPLDALLGINRTLQIVGSALLIFTPIFFAGVIFAMLFGQSREPDWDFGANIAGAMVGGLAEYSSMLVGFRYLVIVAFVFYVLAGLLRRPWSLIPARPPVVGRAASDC